ncbi:prolipoprotein diacylglyceryl transferase family protein, partial [Anaerorhabdus sp.]
MHNELFKIGGLTFYTYGFMIAIGIGLGYVVAQKRGKKLGMNVEVFDSLAIWLFGFG